MPKLHIPTASRDELIVEVHLLEGILNRTIDQRDMLKNQVEQLTMLLGQAAAGMELADLIKRMTS